MLHIDKYEFELLVGSGEEEFKYKIEPNIITKVQLYLSGNILKGIEIFRIGPNEIRSLGFLVEYGSEINHAINNDYRVFIIKNGKYFGQGSWELKFIK